MANILNYINVVSVKSNNIYVNYLILFTYLFFI